MIDLHSHRRSKIDCCFNGSVILLSRFHSQVVVAYFCVNSFQSILNNLLLCANVETITTPLFPDIISKYHLGIIRLGLSFIFFLTTLYRIEFQDHTIIVPYLKRSKLKRIPIKMNSFKSQVMFTSWCWNILTVSFFLNGIICLANRSSIFHNHLALKAAIILFEIAGPTSMLVSCVTKYVLWPRSLQGANGSQKLRLPVSLLQHNLNIISTLLEVCVLGIIPISISDWAVCVLFGLVYISFTWSIQNKLTDCGSPQFVYFFFDLTLGKRWILTVMLGLLCSLLLFFFIFTAIDDFVIWIGQRHIISHLVTSFAISAFACKFHD